MTVTEQMVTPEKEKITWFQCPCGAVYSTKALSKNSWRCVKKSCGRKKTKRWRKWIE